MNSIDNHIHAERDGSLPAAPMARRCAARWRAVVLPWIVGLAVAACGGGDSSAPANIASASIGAAGGTVATASGAQVVVPAGALGAATTIAIERTSAGAPALPQGFVAAGAMFMLTPHGTSFNTPVTVSIPADPSIAPAGQTLALYKGNAAGDWERVPGATLSGATMTGQVSSFSPFIVGIVPPQITQPPQNSEVNEGGTATFSVTAIGSPPFSYLWQESRDGGVTWSTAANGALNRTYTTAPTTPADNGKRYRVVVSNPDAPSESAAATLTVTTQVVAPSGVASPAAPSVVAGANVTLSVAISGTAPTIQWRIKRALAAAFSDLPGETNASLTLTGVQLSDNNAQFVARLHNAAGDADSNIVTLTVTPASSPPATGATRIAAGEEFSFAVNAAGVPYSWGSNGTAALGNGGSGRGLPVATPTPFGSLAPVAAVSAGTGHGIAVLRNGEVWGWGYRGYLDCSFGETAATPMRISGAANIVAASAGSEHTLLLRGDGVVLSFGCNDSGQLGRAGTPAQPSPALAVTIPGTPMIAAVAAGNSFSLALDSQGNVWSWGRGALGNGSNNSSPSSPTPSKIAGLANVIAIAAGQSHALAVKSDGSVWAWGTNDFGQIGDGSTAERTRPVVTLLAPTANAAQKIVAVAAGRETSIAVRADGLALAWGSNQYGQLGNGTTSSMQSTPAPVIGLANVVAVAIGNGRVHSLAVLRDDSVWAWGNNASGQLGDGTTLTTRLAPIASSGLRLN